MSKSVPILKLPSNEILNDHLNASIIKNANIITEDDLKRYHQLYLYKTQLLEKKIKYFITEEDLIEFSKDTNDIINIKLTPFLKSNSYSEHTSYNESKSSESQSNTPKSRRRSRNDTKKLTTSDPMHFFDICINHKIHNIGYSKNNKVYNNFKIENKYKMICEGITDADVNTDILYSLNYDIYTIYDNENDKYEVIMKKTYNMFSDAIYISTINNYYTLSEFLPLFALIVDKIIYTPIKNDIA